MSRIPPSHFVDKASPVVGEQVNVNHDECPAGVDKKRRLFIKRNTDAIVAYCHNCGGKGVYHLTTRDVRSLGELKKLREHTVVKKVTFPRDSDFNPKTWPTPAYAWVAKYGLSDATIEKFKLSYSPNMERVVLPVFDEKGELIFWQGRALHPHQTPKYLSCSIASKPQMFIRCNTPTDVWVIVEDVLSAIRVSEVANAVALLGTSPNSAMSRRLLQSGCKKVVIWLDPDMAGKMGALAVKKALFALFDDVHIIGHDKQPKEMASSSTLREVIYEH